MKTEITKLLNIKYPIFQGGMAWVSDGNLAAAVTNAGGVGLIAGAAAPIDYLENEIKKAKELTKDGMFGVNVMLMSPNADELADLVVKLGVKIVTTGAGSPAKYIEKWKEAGIKIFPVVPSVALAQRMERLGVDGIIVEGMESGGHIGSLTTMTLLQQVTEKITIPVIAAGGIASGKGVAAALTMGASGVQCGTCFLVADECNIHENYKELVLKAKDTSTTTTGNSHGHPIRSIKNKMTKKYISLENEGATFEELENLTLGSLRKAVVEGNKEEGSFMAGQIAGLVNEKKPCSEIIETMFKDAKNILEDTYERFGK